MTENEIALVILAASFLWLAWFQSMWLEDDRKLIIKQQRKIDSLHELLQLHGLEAERDEVEYGNS